MPKVINEVRKFLRSQRQTPARVRVRVRVRSRSDAKPGGIIFLFFPLLLLTKRICRAMIAFFPFPFPILTISAPAGSVPGKTT